MRVLAGLALLLGLAWSLRAGLVAFAGYVVVGVVLASRYVAREWITNLSANRECDTTPREVGDEIEVALKLTNGSKLPVAWVLIEDLAAERAVQRRRLTLRGSRLRVLFLWPGESRKLRYYVTFNGRGYYPIGPTVAETGDVFGLLRRHRVLTGPAYVLVYPRAVPLPGYDFASRRPVGEVRLANRLFEDPTRSAGVRPYQRGDPLQRIHWRATARTGELHSRIYEPTSLAGATILLDLHEANYPRRGEPERSDLAVTIAVSIAEALVLMKQPVGLVSNGRDAADRIRDEALALGADDAVGGEEGYQSRAAARELFEPPGEDGRLKPLVIETRRGYDQFQQIREALARLEVSDRLTFEQMVIDAAPRMTRDATVIAVVPAVSVAAAVALGQLRRQGFAVSALVVGEEDGGAAAKAVGRLMAEGIRDVRPIGTEAELQSMGRGSAAEPPPEYGLSVELA